MDGAFHGTLRTPSNKRAHPLHQNSARQASQTADFTPVIHRDIPYSATVGQLPIPGTNRRAERSSATWTSSSGDLVNLSDTDDIQDRPEFVHEYNRLARKVGTPSAMDLGHQQSH